MLIKSLQENVKTCLQSKLRFLGERERAQSLQPITGRENVMRAGFGSIANFFGNGRISEILVATHPKIAV